MKRNILEDKDIATHFAAVGCVPTGSERRHFSR